MVNEVPVAPDIDDTEPVNVVEVSHCLAYPVGEFDHVPVVEVNVDPTYPSPVIVGIVIIPGIFKPLYTFVQVPPIL